MPHPLVIRDALPTASGIPQSVIDSFTPAGARPTRIENAMPSFALPQQLTRVAAVQNFGFGWGPAGGAASLLDGILVAGDGKYDQHTDSGFNGNLAVSFGAIAAPQAGVWTLFFRLACSPLSPWRLGISLINAAGGANIWSGTYGGQSNTNFPPDFVQNITPGLTTYSHVLSAGEIAAINFASSLDVNIFATENNSTGDFFQCDYVQIVAPPAVGAPSGTPNIVNATAGAVARAKSIRDSLPT